MKTLRTLTTAVTLALLGGLAFHFTAVAEEPKCPCWSETSLLAVVADLMADLGNAERCDSHPMIQASSSGVSQSAKILGPSGMDGFDADGFDIQAFASGLGSSIGEPERVCLIRVTDIIEERIVSESEFWRCVNDITQLCKDMGLPPIE